jgi:translation initiation factor 2 subunit 3
MSRTFYTSFIKDQQPVANIGTIGHVSHGKSTVVKAFTGKHTPTRSDEIERNITINLGFANLRIYYNEQTKNFKYSEKRLLEDGYILVNHISFVDCPGHSSYTATMISGSKVFDAALLVIAASSPIPAPQTAKHTELLEFTNIQNLLVLLNKIDLLKDQTMIDSCVQQLSQFMTLNVMLKEKSVLPIVASQKYNIDQVLSFLANVENKSLVTQVNFDFKMQILRSFMVNPVGVTVKSLIGGIAGGSIQSGYIEVGDKVGIFPGTALLEKENGVKKWIIKPIFATVTSLKSENDALQVAFAGGLIAIGLNCDPGLCKQNELLGNNLFKLSSKNIHLYCSPQNYSSRLKVQFTTLMGGFLVEEKMHIYIIINSKPIQCTVKSVVGCIMSLKLEIPIYVVDIKNIPLLTLVDGVIKVFGIGNIESSTNNVTIKLPSDFDDFILPESFDTLNIIDDSSFSENFDYALTNLQENITNFHHETSLLHSKIKFPDLDIRYEPLRILWINFAQYQNMMNEIINGKELVQVRILNLEKMIVPYIAYVYGIPGSSVNFSNDLILVHIKTKRLKQKLDKLVKVYFKHYYYCEAASCRKLSCVIGKVNNKYFKICFHCGERTILNDTWLKM